MSVFLHSAKSLIQQAMPHATSTSLTLNGGPVENRTPFIPVQAGYNTHYTTSPLIGYRRRNRTHIFGFGDQGTTIVRDGINWSEM